MDGQEHIIQKLFTEQQCHRCKQLYQPENIVVLIRRLEVWIVMLSCTSCDQKDTYVVKFPSHLPGQQGRRVTSYRLSKPPIPPISPSTPLPEELLSQPPTPSDVPDIPETPRPAMLVNVDDVLDMHLFLERFNGDFQTLFAEFGI